MTLPRTASTAAAPSLHSPARRWRLSSVSIIVTAWAVLQLSGLFTPGLLDDVDSIYIQIAREMLQRHDFVTPTIDGIRFFDKPPLMYWMAAGSMHIFGVHDWAARLPLALGVLALLFAVYALGNRLYGASGTGGGAPGLASETWVSTDSSDRPGLYAALATATSLGPYLYTRFYIPDILIALWMTLSIHLFLLALDRTRDDRSPLLPSLGFAAVMALDVLTKGLIGMVFPLAFVLLYLAITHRLRLLAKLQIPAVTALFLALAAPWHVLVALRNPAIPMPAGVGLPARAGWAWFYLYNEHIARFLGRRIPHDYGQTPIWLFLLYALIWIMPWGAFLPAAIASIRRSLRRYQVLTYSRDPREARGAITPQHLAALADIRRQRQAALTLILWALVVLVFFTLSSRQEYYSLPALPALALMVGGLLASAESVRNNTDPHAASNALACHRWFLLPLAGLIAALCVYFAVTAPQPRTGVTLNDVLSTNPALYNLSLGHIFDLTGQAMGFFRGPLLVVALGMIILGPIAYLIRRAANVSTANFNGANSKFQASEKNAHSFAANLTLAAGMIVVLLAAHQGLVRFYPILGSKDLALAIDTQLQPGDLIAIDGELTAGSTLLFYTPQRDQPVLLVNGRKNGPWFGSFWPDAPHIFLDDTGLQDLWAGPHRVFLLSYHPTRRAADLRPFGLVIDFANSGGKTILTNRSNRP